MEKMKGLFNGWPDHCKFLVTGTGQRNGQPFLHSVVKQRVHLKIAGFIISESISQSRQNR